MVKLKLVAVEGRKGAGREAKTVEWLTATLRMMYMPRDRGWNSASMSKQPLT
jgi:hypothetical protein